MTTISLTVAAQNLRAEIVGTPIILDLSELTTATDAAEASAVAAAASQAAAAGSAAAADADAAAADADAATATTQASNASASAAAAAASEAALTTALAAEYIVAVANASLTAERVVTNTTEVTGDFGTAAQAKFNLAAGVVNVQTLVTAVATDHVLIADASDSGNKKKALVSDIVSLSVASAGRVLLETLTPSAVATIACGASIITSAFDHYVIEFENVIPATGNAGLLLRFSIDGGSNYDATNYVASIVGTIGAGDATFRSDSLTTGVLLTGRNTSFDGVATTAALGASGTVNMRNPNSAANKFVNGTSAWRSGNAARTNVATIGAEMTTTSVINRVQFLFTAGNITSGKIRIYGIRTS